MQFNALIDGVLLPVCSLQYWVSATTYARFIKKTSRTRAPYILKVLELVVYLVFCLMRLEQL